MEHLSIEKIQEYLSGHIDPCEKQNIENHVDYCENCKSLLEYERIMGESLKDISVSTTSPGFEDKVMNKIILNKKRSKYFSLVMFICSGGFVLISVLGLLSALVYSFYQNSSVMSQFLTMLYPSFRETYLEIAKINQTTEDIVPNLFDVSNLRYLIPFGAIYLLYLLIDKIMDRKLFKI